MLNLVTPVLLSGVSWSLVIHAWRHADDYPDFDWHTMQCVRPGKLDRED